MSTKSGTYGWRPADPPPPRVTGGVRLLIYVAFILFVAGGLAFGSVFYQSLRERLAAPLNPASSSLPSLPGAASAPGGGATSKPSTTEQQPAAPAAGAWSGKERVNILLLGIDQRESEAGQPTRTDTMMLLTIDPAGKSMGLLSIPRDLWVPIPGLKQVSEDRINSAHFYGDAYNYPGGGPALAKRTVQYNLGVPVHYYVRIDFNGFKKIVDTMGGVDINVEKAIHDSEYPDGNYGIITIDIPAGMQHMDGDRALQFVRTRHADSDFFRTRRQQQFLMAMRDQAMSLNIVPRLPTLISQLRDSVKTDLSATEIINLARIASQVEKANISSRIIDESMITSWTTPQGGSVLIPKREAIKGLVEDLFAAPEPPTPTPVPAKPTVAPTAAPAARSNVNRELLQQENARIEILNGTNTQGLAGRTRTYLAGLGYHVTTIGDAGRYDYKDCVLVYYSTKKVTQAGLIQLFGIKPENVRSAPSPRADADIRIILGSNAVVP